MKKVSNNIKKLRKSKHITMDQLASSVGVGKPTVSRWESEKILPTLENWQALAKYFNVSVAYLQGAYSNKEIAKIVQERRLNDDKQEKGSLFLIFMPVTSKTIENYLIAIGVIPYNIPKEKDLLKPEQINNLDFWVKNLELLYNDVAMQWLINKPNLDASKEDVLSAINSAMNTVINASTTSYNKYDAFSYNYNMEQVVKNHYMQKRLEFLKQFEYWDDVETAEGHYEEYSVHDFKCSHPLDGKKYYIEDGKHFYFDENDKRQYID